MSPKGPGVCQCQNQPRVGCSRVITQEDLLCDDCRAGCNSFFLQSASILEWIIPGTDGPAYFGPHIKLTIMSPEELRDL